MTTPPDPPPNIVTMRMIGMVWVAVGVLALLGGVVATVFVVAIFGVLAILLGAGLVAIQEARARSAIRGSRTLTNAPPAAPPPTTPGRSRSGFAGPMPGPPDDPYGGRWSSGDDSGPEAAVGPTGRGEEGPGGGGGSSDGDRPDETEGAEGTGAEEHETSSSEQEGGTGSPTEDDDASGSRRD